MKHIQMGWDDTSDDMIYTITLEGLWTLAEYHEHYPVALHAIQQSSQPVVMLVNVALSQLPPTQLLAIRADKTLRQPAPLKGIVVVGGGRVIEAWLKIMARHNPELLHMVHLVATLEEGRATAQAILSPDSAAAAD